MRPGTGAVVSGGATDLLFCWIECGECQLTRPDCAPLTIRKGDFVLIRTVAPFALTSDAGVEPVDSETAVAATGHVRLSVGSGIDRPVTLHAGKITFDTANEDLLSPLLPHLVHLAASDTSLGRVRALLTLNEAEARQPGPASAFIIVRLVELILVEILRCKPLQVGAAQTGLLAGLADAVTSRALAAMHRDVAHDWTVASWRASAASPAPALRRGSAKLSERRRSTICCSGGWHSPRTP